MNLTIYDEIEKISLFKLWHLHSRISKIFEDPVKLGMIKSQLKVGMSVSYVNAAVNPLVFAAHPIDSNKYCALSNSSDVIQFSF